MAFRREGTINGQEIYSAVIGDTLSTANIKFNALCLVTNGDVHRFNGTSWDQIVTGSAAHISDAAHLSGNSQVTVSLTTTAAQSAALAAGIYDVWCDVDCFIKVNATANDVTTANGYLLRANNTIPLIIPDQEKLGGIVASGTGTLSYHKVS
jgi:hypothetical protein